MDTDARAAFFELDSDGYPLLYAPSASDELGDPSIPVRSGNPHRQGGGRFGAGDPAAQKGKGAANGKASGVPGAGAARAGGAQQVAKDLGEQHRREDAVRDAAREFETFQTQDIIDWLKGRITRPLSAAEVAQFEKDVRAQQLVDLSDILDQMVLGESRGRRHVKVRAPKGYLRKTLAALTDDELMQLDQRLRARGWTDKQVKDGLVARLPLDRRDAVSSSITQKQNPSHSDKVVP